MSEKIKKMFSRISPSYDFFNHFLSMGTDYGWREEAAKEMMLDKNKFSVLDLATGTGDLAIAVYGLAKARGKQGSIEGSDFTPAMIALAKQKIRKMNIQEIKFKVGDAIKTGYKTKSFDVVTSGFALRSMDSLDDYISESYRILKKPGRMVLLEMAKPNDKSQRLFFAFYSNFIRFTSIFSDREAYNWMLYTVNRFNKKKLVSMARTAGFKKIKLRSLASGIAFLLIAEK